MAVVSYSPGPGLSHHTPKFDFLLSHGCFPLLLFSLAAPTIPKSSTSVSGEDRRSDNGQGGYTAKTLSDLNRLSGRLPRLGLFGIKEVDIADWPV